MIKITQLKVQEGADRDHIRSKAAGILGVGNEDIRDFFVLKRSRDARNKGNITDVYSLAVSVSDEKDILRRCRNKNVSEYKEGSYRYPSHGKAVSGHRPVIIGFGPAGIFLAYILAHEGYRPIVFERGKKIDERVRDVEEFWEKGRLLSDSNVQFGEGGAGTFSDGKLNSGIKDRDGRRRFVLNTFIKHGADEEISYESHPHIGTDVLRKVIPSMRTEIEKMGGEIHFCSCMTDISTDENGICGIRVNERDIVCRELFMAVGHSARDTFEMLYKKGVMLEAKPFAVGVRAEHRREMIDKALHQDKASYKLTYHCDDGRGVYSFCMCPGGYVVDSSSENGRLTVNGMSYSGREGINSNAAIVCTVDDEDFRSYGEDPLRGMRFQREIEKRAYDEGKGNIPYQRYEDFRAGRISDHTGEVKPECKGRYALGNIRNILPECICNDIIEAMQNFGGRIKGYDGDDTLFAGIEGRTSSPVRILRDDEMMSVNTKGLYPVGEGAGYAGGIMSAAIDGIKAAEKYISQYAE